MASSNTHPRQFELLRALRPGATDATAVTDDTPPPVIASHSTIPISEPGQVDDSVDALIAAAQAGQFTIVEVGFAQGNITPAQGLAIVAHMQALPGMSADDLEQAKVDALALIPDSVVNHFDFL